MTARKIPFDGCIYDRDGNTIGVVTNIEMECDPIDVTTHLDSTRQFIAGKKTTTLTAKLNRDVEYAPPSLNNLWRCGYCHGMMPSTQHRCDNCGAPRR